MSPETQMPAAPISRSLNLGPERTVTDAGTRGRGGGPCEPHVSIERTPGHALRCPRCGAMHGVYDTRERTRRHLDVRRCKTFVHRGLPRLDRGEGGPAAAEAPWAAPDAKHLTALSEAQVLPMAMSSMPVRGMAKVLREHDTRVWAMLRRVAAKARAAASFSGAAEVGVDETARRRGQNYPASFAGLGEGRVMFCALGRDAGTVAGSARDLSAHGGDPEKAGVAACDMSPAFAKGAAESPPDAVRVAGRLRVVRLAATRIDKVRAAESREPEEKGDLPSRTEHIWLKNEGNLTEAQAARKRDLSKERLKTARACAMKEALQAVYECGSKEEAAAAELDALCSWIMHSNVPQTKPVAKTLRENRDEVLNYFDHRRTNAVLEGINSVIQSAKRLARGLGNLEYFKTVIYLKLGKLSFPQLEVCATH